MTTFFARFTPEGRYTEAGSVSDDAPVLSEPDVYIGVVDRDTQYHTADGPTDMPPRPSPLHIFDFSTKQWTIDSDAQKARLKVEVDAERDRRIFDSIIVYDGKNIDADAVSIDRLSKKLAAIDAYEKIGQQMPARMLVWRDADNLTHAFATQAEYKAWLAGLAVALDMRGTLAFAWSWEKKSQLQSLTSAEDILAFDPVQ